MVKAGNERALQTLDALFGSHFEVMLRLARRWSVCEDEAQDAVMDAFLRVSSHVMEFGPDAFTDLSAYWRRAITNGMVGAHRRRTRFPTYSTEISVPLDGDRDFFVFEMPDPAPPVYTQIEAVEARRQVRAALEVLSPEHRGVVEGFYFCGREVEALAVEFECAPGTVKSRLARTRQRLKRRLDSAISAEDVGNRHEPKVKRDGQSTRSEQSQPTVSKDVAATGVRFDFDAAKGARMLEQNARRLGITVEQMKGIK